MLRRLFLLLSLCCLLTSCTASHKNITSLNTMYPIETSEWIDLSDYPVIVNMWLLPSGLFFLTCDSMNDMSILEAYCYRFTDQEYKWVGTINNMLFIGGTQRIVNNNLYFCVNSFGSDGERVNTLYQVDLEKCEMTVVSHDNYYQTFNYMIEFNGHLLLTRGDLNNNSGEGATWIDIVHEDQAIECSPIQYRVQTGESRDGQVLLNCFVKDNELYCVVEETQGDIIRYYFDIYDNEFNRTSSYEVSELNKILNGKILYNTNMLGDFLYIRDFSMNSCAASFTSNIWTSIPIPEKVEQAQYNFEYNQGYTILSVNTDQNELCYFSQNNPLSVDIPEIDSSLGILNVHQCGALVFLTLEKPGDAGNIKQYYLTSLDLLGVPEYQE